MYRTLPPGRIRSNHQGPRHHRGIVGAQPSHGRGTARLGGFAPELSNDLTHIVNDRRTEEYIGLSFGLQRLAAISSASLIRRNRCASLIVPGCR